MFNHEIYETHEKNVAAFGRKPDKERMFMENAALSRAAATTKGSIFPAGVRGKSRYAVRMELFYKILKTAVEGSASDVHLKIGTPVIYRINRELIAVDSPFPTAEWMNKVV